MVRRTHTATRGKYRECILWSQREDLSHSHGGATRGRRPHAREIERGVRALPERHRVLHYPFLSEEEVERRWEAMVEEGQRRMVDLAIAYAGMGHVTVLSYDPITDGVFTGLDGGANGWDREANHRTRVGQDVGSLTTVSLETWWTAS